jgi:hypothetical protein
MSNSFFCNFCRIQFADETGFHSHWQLNHDENKSKVNCAKNQSPNTSQNPGITDCPVFDNDGRSLRRYNGQNFGGPMGPMALPATHTLSQSATGISESLGENRQSLLKTITLLQKMQPNSANAHAPLTPLTPPALSTNFSNAIEDQNDHHDKMPASASGISQSLGGNRVSLLKTITLLKKISKSAPTQIAPPAPPLYHCVICNIDLQDQSQFEIHLIACHWFTGQ